MSLGDGGGPEGCVGDGRAGVGGLIHMSGNQMSPRQQKLCGRRRADGNNNGELG